MSVICFYILRLVDSCRQSRQLRDVNRWPEVFHQFDVLFHFLWPTHPHVCHVYSWVREDEFQTDLIDIRRFSPFGGKELNNPYCFPPFRLDVLSSGTASANIVNIITNKNITKQTNIRFSFLPFIVLIFILPFLTIFPRGY